MLTTHNVSKVPENILVLNQNLHLTEKLNRLTMTRDFPIIFYLYDYQSEKSTLLHGNLTGILGYSPAMIADIFKLGYSISDSADLHCFLKDIEFETNKIFNNHPKGAALSEFKFTIEYKAKRVRGDYAWINHQMYVIDTDQEGNPLLSMNTITDVTDFKKDETLRYTISKKEQDGLFSTVLNITYGKTKLPDLISDREAEIIKLICQGKSSSEIAELLFISHNTVKQHRKNIHKKTGVKNVAGLIAFMNENTQMN